MRRWLLLSCSLLFAMSVAVAQPVPAQSRRLMTRCPKGTVLVGLRGEAFLKVEELEAVCVPILAGAWQGDPKRSGETAGNGAAKIFDDRCARDQVVTKIETRKTSSVDAVRITCRDLNASNEPTGSDFIHKAIGSSAAGTFSGTDCRGRRAIGATVTLDTAMSDVEILCEPEGPEPTRLPQPASSSSQTVDVVAGTPGAPELVWPGESALVRLTRYGLSLRWKEVEGASHYEVCLTRKADTRCSSSSALRKKDLSKTSMTIPTGELEGFFGREIYWRATACSATDCIESAPRLVRITFPPATPIFPAKNVLVSTRRPTFEWIDVPGAEYYELHLADEAMRRNNKTISFRVDREHRFVPKEELDLGSPVYWYVLACNKTTGCGDPDFPIKFAMPEKVLPEPLSWNSPITTATFAELADPRIVPTDVRPLLEGRTLGAIINSRASVRGDGRVCSRCHYTESDLPYAPPVQPSGRSSIGPDSQIHSRTWSEDGGWADLFIQNDKKELYLRALLQKWRSDGSKR